jgi:hypothetical protein
MMIGSVGFLEQETGLRLEASENARTRFSATIAGVREARTWQVTQATVVEVRPAASMSLDWGMCQNMTDGQKKPAVAAEKKRAAKKKGRAVQANLSSRSKAVFTNGGHKFDPLNSKI